jgi:septal ring factor EnvC (AmiA/AmiB activator)
MSQQVRLAGWSDAERPAVQKEAGLHEFKFKLSESPAPPWKAVFAELSRSQQPMASIDQDQLVLSCELQEIENAVAQIKQRLQTVNETIDRREREIDERAARQQVDNEQRRARILTAVKNIRFDEN